MEASKKTLISQIVAVRLSQKVGQAICSSTSGDADAVQLQRSWEVDMHQARGIFRVASRMMKNSRHLKHGANCSRLQSLPACAAAALAVACICLALTIKVYITALQCSCNRFVIHASSTRHQIVDEQPTNSWTYPGLHAQSIPNPHVSPTHSNKPVQHQQHYCHHANSALPASRILVTGAAGFIGFHACQALAKLAGTFILGLDNFNAALYDPQIKQARQALLSTCCNVTVIQGDIRNSALLQELFACYNFTQVVHLAAQAGVRLSVQHPEQYVTNNIEGTVSLLEAIRYQKHPASLVYASSSSVYGLPLLYQQQPRQLLCDNQHTQPQLQAPLEPAADNCTDACSCQRLCSRQPSSMVGSPECSMRCGLPVSMYAASKRATEDAVAVYHHQYGITAIGLRFFTVYGTYGRPDMAVMKFIQHIMQATPINITCFERTAAMTEALYKLRQARSDAVIRNSGAFISAPTTYFIASTRHTLNRSRLEVPGWCVPAYRDFTAVDDIVQGILAACSKTSVRQNTLDNSRLDAAAPMHSVYNLGRGQPISVAELLQLLEQLLERQAVQVNFLKPTTESGLPSQGRADVWMTWADTTAAARDLGFRAGTAIQRGLQPLVEWYKAEHSITADVY